MLSEFFHCAVRGPSALLKGSQNLVGNLGVRTLAEVTLVKLGREILQVLPPITDHSGTVTRRMLFGRHSYELLHHRDSKINKHSRTTYTSFFTSLPIRTISQSAGKRSLDVASETVSSFGEHPIKVVIDWRIPDFSALKTRTSSIRSDKTDVGISAWSISMYPLSPSQKTMLLVDSSSIYLNHEFLSDHIKEIPATFDFCLLDQKDTVLLKSNHFFAFTKQQASSGYLPFFKHKDLWGPNPTISLQKDILRVRVDITYSPPKVSAIDRIRLMEPLQKKLKSLHDSVQGRTFTLVSEGGTERHVHPGILEVGSPFFRAMLQSDMQERAASRCEMPVVSTATLDILLRFMYYNCTEGVKGHERTVIVAADMHQMDDLKECCERILVSEISDQTAVDLLLLADKVTAVALKDAALRHIIANFKVLESSKQIDKLLDEGGKSLNREVLAAIARWGVK